MNFKAVLITQWMTLITLPVAQADLVLPWRGVGYEFGFHTVIQAKTLYQKLATKGTFTSRKKLPPGMEDGGCGKIESYVFTRLMKCGGGIVFRARMEEGCTGGSGSAVWEAQ